MTEVEAYHEMYLTMARAAEQAIRPTILGVVNNDALTAALDADGVIEIEQTVEGPAE